MRRLVVLGLDGADWKIIDPLIQEGSLPNLKKLIQKGSRTRLASTVPPLTAPAWISIFTGMNPGKHGIFDFVRLEKGSIVFTNSSDMKLPYVWEMIDKHSVAFNIPFIYPPRPTRNAVIVSGFDTPSTASPFAYPKEVKDEILSLEPDFRFFFSWKASLINKGLARDKQGMAESILENLESKIRISRHLLENKTWDAAFLVFSATDCMQHYFMTEFMSAKKKSQTNIAKTYARLDRFIGYLLSIDCDIILVSDHGFREVKRACFPNTYLHQKGMLSLRSNPFSSMLKAIGITRENANRILIPHSPLWSNSKYVNGFIRRLPSRNPAPEAIDASKSDAFMISTSGNGVMLRDPAKAEAISKLLLESTDEDGRSMIKKVLTKQDVYNGPMLSRAPDLLLIPEDGVSLKETIHSRLSEKIDPDREVDGRHDSHGIFLCYGDGFEKREIGDMSVTDITPTVLAYFGHQVPSSMDGKPAPTVKAGETKHTRQDESARIRSIIRSRNLAPKRTKK